jgi:hypothetical protein
MHVLLFFIQQLIVLMFNGTKMPIKNGITILADRMLAYGNTWAGQTYACFTTVAATIQIALC